MSRLPLGGIISFGCFEMTRLMISLSALTPRTINGSPDSPPRRMPSVVSSLSLALEESSPWQSKQCFSRMGRTVFSKKLASTATHGSSGWQRTMTKKRRGM